MQELDFEEHEERQRKKLLAKDMESKGNSKVSDPADENVDIKMEEDETQVVDGVGTHTPEADELETEGCDFQEGKETEHVTGGGEPQATEAGGFQAGDYHENAAQPEGEALPPNNTEATEGAVREAPSAHNPEVRVAQIIGGAASVGGSPFIGTMKKQQRDSSSVSSVRFQSYNYHTNTWNRPQPQRHPRQPRRSSKTTLRPWARMSTSWSSRRYSNKN
jgi:hypothetical protein